MSYLGTLARQRALIVFLVALLACMAPARSSADDVYRPQWTVRALTGLDTTKAMLGADIAVDAKGVVHVVWAESPADDSAGPHVIRYVNNAAGDFTAIRTISKADGYAQAPTIALHTKDEIVTLHVAYEARFFKGAFAKYDADYRDPALKMNIAHTFSSDGGGSWSAPTALPASPDYGQSYAPALTVDPSGTVHLVFGGRIGDVDGCAHLEIYYASWSGGAWSAPSFLSARQHDASYNMNPAIAWTVKDGKVTLHVWYGGTICGAEQSTWQMLSLSRTEGGNWSEKTTVHDTGRTRRARLAVWGSEVHAVWFAEHAGDAAEFEPYHSASSDFGATFSVPVSIGTGSAGDGIEPAVAVAGTGTVAVVWAEPGVAGQDAWFNYSADGATWGSASAARANPTCTANPSDVQCLPRAIHVEPGRALGMQVVGSCANFHAVWVEDGNGAPWHVMYGETGPTNAGHCLQTSPECQEGACPPDETQMQGGEDGPGASVVRSYGGHSFDSRGLASGCACTVRPSRPSGRDFAGLTFAGAIAAWLGVRRHRRKR